MRDHKKLRAFELADQLALVIYEVSRSFPADERFGLTSQIRRAAVSAPSNIVEGCARSTDVDFVRFLDVANGSTCEVEYQLSLAHRLGFLSDSEYSTAADLASETARVLNALIRAIRERIA